MFIYYLFFFIFSSLSLLGQRRIIAADSGYFKNNFNLLWLFISLILVLLIGLRFEVGGDWDNCLFGYNQIKDSSLEEIFSNPASFISDPLYLILIGFLQH